MTPTTSSTYGCQRPKRPPAAKISLRLCNSGEPSTSAELRRRQVPGLLLSDGTVPQVALESEELPEGTWQACRPRPGGPPAPLEWSTTRPRTYRARRHPGGGHHGSRLDTAVHDGRRLGDRDRSPLAHGPSVARERHSPAVICLPAPPPDPVGQTWTIDGAAGTVQVLDDPSTNRGSQ